MCALFISVQTCTKMNVYYVVVMFRASASCATFHVMYKYFASPDS